MAASGVGGERAGGVGLHHVDGNALLGGKEIAVKEVGLLNFGAHPVKIFIAWSELTSAGGCLLEWHLAQFSAKTIFPRCSICSILRQVCFAPRRVRQLGPFIFIRNFARFGTRSAVACQYTEFFCALATLERPLRLATDEHVVVAQPLLAVFANADVNAAQRRRSGRQNRRHPLERAGRPSAAVRRENSAHRRRSPLHGPPSCAPARINRVDCARVV